MEKKGEGEVGCEKMMRGKEKKGKKEGGHEDDERQRKGRGRQLRNVTLGLGFFLFILGFF